HGLILAILADRLDDRLAAAHDRCAQARAPRAHAAEDTQGKHELRLHVDGLRARLGLEKDVARDAAGARRQYLDGDTVRPLALELRGRQRIATDGARHELELPLADLIRAPVDDLHARRARAI